MAVLGVWVISSLTLDPSPAGRGRQRLLVLVKRQRLRAESRHGFALRWGTFPPLPAGEGRGEISPNWNSSRFEPLNRVGRAVLCPPLPDTKTFMAGHGGAHGVTRPTSRRFMGREKIPPTLPATVLPETPWTTFPGCSPMLRICVSYILPKLSMQ